MLNNQHRDYQLRNANKVLRRIQHSSLASSFGAWLVSVHARVRMRAVGSSRRTAATQDAVAAFGMWSRQTDWCKQSRTKIRRMASHWRMLSVSRCFESWREHVDSAHRQYAQLSVT